MCALVTNKEIMRIIDVLTSPWAIEPEKFQQICAVYRRRVLEEKIDVAAFEAAYGKRQAEKPESYNVVNGTALIPLTGVLAKRMNLLSNISGGTSTRIFQLAMEDAVQNPDVKSIVVSIDSPGGTVDGTQAAMQSIRSARQYKRVVALADGMMASAAYWIGSAAESVYIADETTVVGSIGVVTTHEDWSRAEDAAGVRVTEITAGRYKRIASEHAPLSPEGRASIQEQVDAIYKVFVDDVAANRGRDAETVLRDMADGRVFTGKKAIDAGLADGIKSLPEVTALLSTPIKQGARAPKSKGTNMDKVTIYGTECESQEQVVAALDKVEQAVAASMQTKHAAELAEVRAEAIEAGAKAERERIAAIEAAALPGHEALVAQMKADGTSAADAALKILAAEKNKLAQMNKNLHADAPDPAPVSEPGNAAPSPDYKELARRAAEYVDAEAAKGKTISYTEAVEKVSAKGGQYA